MADGEKDWNPEGEDPQDALREHNKLAREMIDVLKAQVKPGELVVKAKAELLKLRARMETTPPPPGLSGIAYRHPTLSQEAAKLARVWAKVKEVLGDAPQQVKAMAFQSLMHARDDEPASGALPAVAVGADCTHEYPLIGDEHRNAGGKGLLCQNGCGAELGPHGGASAPPGIDPYGACPKAIAEPKTPPVDSQGPPLPA